MIRASLILFFFLASLTGLAQTPEVAQSITRNAFSKALDEGNGNYYIAYNMTGAYGTDIDFDRDSNRLLRDNNGQDFYIVKYDVNDSLLWTLRLRSTTLSLRDMCYDPKGELVISIQFADSVGIGNDTLIQSSGDEAALVKLDPKDGSLRSYHPFHSKGTVALVKFQLVNGNYLICMNGSDSVDIDLRNSNTYQIPAGEHSLKLKPDGSVIWVTPELPFSYSEFSSDTSGGLYIKTYVNGSRTRVFTSPGNKLDTASSMIGYTYIIYKRNKNGYFEYANFMNAGQLLLDKSSTSENGLYLAGFTDNSEDHAYEFQNGDSVISENGGYGSFLAYMHANGDMLWYKHFDDKIWDVFYNVGHDKDDNAYCSGRFRDTLDADWGPRESLIWPASVVNNELNAYVVKSTKDGRFAGAFAISDIQQSDHLYTLSGNKVLVSGYSRFGKSADFDPGKGRFVASPDSTPNQDFLAIYSYPDVLYDTLYRQTCKNKFDLYGKTYTKSGTYLDTLEDGFRPRYLTFILNMLRPSNGSIDVSGCDSVVVNGIAYYKSGIYNQDLKNDVGCDSSLRVFAEIHQSTDTAIYIESCDGVRIQDTTYEKSGSYEHYFLSSKGCDSLVTYHIDIIEKDTGVVYAENCSFALVNGEVYKETGTFYQRVPRTGKCDSIVVVDVEIFGKDTTKRVIADCEPVQYHDQTLDKTGTYYVRFRNQHDCDSMVQVQFTLQERDTFDLEYTSCGPFIYKDTVFETEGFHYFRRTAKCDTVFAIDLTITELDTDISRRGDTLIAAQAQGTYQWRDCDLDENISGATSRTFRPTSTGKYQVILNHESCTDTTECFVVDQLSLTLPNVDVRFKLYPNPTHDLIRVQCEVPGNKRIEVFTIGGKLVRSREFTDNMTTVDLTDQSAGVYLFVTSLKGQILRQRIVKY